MENSVQIDVKQITDQYAVCNMYTEFLCCQIVMRLEDYDYLNRKGFFIRDGKEKDSAGILNTSHVYKRN